MADRPRTLAEAQDDLRAAWQDLWLAVLDALGFVAFVRRRGWQVRAWVLEAEERRASRER